MKYYCSAINKMNLRDLEETPTKRTARSTRWNFMLSRMDAQNADEYADRRGLYT